MKIGPKVVGSSCSQRAGMSMLRAPFKRVRFGYGPALFFKMEDVWLVRDTFKFGT